MHILQVFNTTHHVRICGPSSAQVFRDRWFVDLCQLDLRNSEVYVYVEESLRPV